MGEEIKTSLYDKDLWTEITDLKADSKRGSAATGKAEGAPRNKVHAKDKKTPVNSQDQTYEFQSELLKKARRRAVKRKNPKVRVGDFLDSVIASDCPPYDAPRCAHRADKQTKSNWPSLIHC